MSNVKRIEPSECFWEVNLELYSEDENGKVKKSKEVHLVDAKTVSDAESKVKEEMDGSLSEYRIKSIKKSSICVGY